MIDPKYHDLVRHYDELPFFHEYLGAEILEVGDKHAKAKMAFKPQLANNHGFFHGGAIFALGDSVVGLAACTVNMRCVTIDANINYLSNIRQGDLYVEVDCLHYGAATAVFTAKFTAEGGRLLAEGRYTMFVNKNKRVNLQEKEGE